MNDPHVHPRRAIVASLLHENSGMSLTEMSRKLKVPISSLFDTIKEVEKDFLLTIVLKESERDAPPRDSLPLEFAYQVTIDTSPKEADNKLKGMRPQSSTYDKYLLTTIDFPQMIEI